MIMFGIGFAVGAVVTGFVARYRPEWFGKVATSVEGKIDTAKVAVASEVADAVKK